MGSEKLSQIYLDALSAKADEAISVAANPPRVLGVVIAFLPSGVETAVLG